MSIQPLVVFLATEWCKTLECNDRYGDCFKADSVCDITKDFVAGAEQALAARDKEWMAWLLENLFRETDYGLEWQSTPRIALKRLAERKLEIGL
jgi:hypothetical protein